MCYESITVCVAVECQEPLMCKRIGVNKLVQLQNAADSTGCDIIAVSETWLNHTVSDKDILVDNYVIYR